MARATTARGGCSAVGPCRFVYARYMKKLLAIVCGAVLFAGCSSAPAGPSLDQQQQAWEQETEAKSCEDIKATEPGSVELRWTFEASAAGENWADEYKAHANAKGDGRPYRCAGPVFERYLKEDLVNNFPWSPKGEAGETTAPLPRS